MSVKLFFYILWCRKWLVLAVLIGTIAATAYLTSKIPKQYAAYTTLVLDFRDSGPFDQSGPGLPRYATSSYLSTQADIISSRRVALKSLDKLGDKQLSKLAGLYLGPYAAAHASESSVRDRLADILLNKLTIDVSNESRVIEIWTTTPDPMLTAEIANAFAQAYIDISLELNIDPARRNAEWFDGQLQALRSRVEEKQRELTKYQADKGIVSIDERLDTEMQRFEELSSSLVDAQAETYNVRSRQLGSKHPEYLRALAREKSVEQSLEQQKARVLEVRQVRDELSLLLRDVENARRTYDMALQEFYQNTLESQFNQTNVAVLNEAGVPRTPSSPNMKLSLALATLLGLVFGCGLALAAELATRKVRMEEDLTAGAGLRVLASV